MRRAQVIIGANYGDEGKGLMTDYFASQDPEQSIVVRFNGGAQAGHTVVTPDGRRHVFSHFGSASFLGCPTFLSKYFIVNPMFFVKELALLRDKGANPETFVDPSSIVSTPYDVFINQLIERRRAGARHGSCGLGINETVTRCLRGDAYRTEVRDLLDPVTFVERLKNMAKSWFIPRLLEHKLDAISDEVLSFMNKLDKIIERYMIDVADFLYESRICKNLPDYKNILFEGAQGLMLDEARLDQFPHLTRSRTGLTNVVELAKQMGIEELNVTYVTRTYLTRHGAGPLKNEENWSIRDETNIPNQFQGTLRFAQLDLDELKYSIELDLAQAKFCFPKINANFAVTCADQMPLPAEQLLPLQLKYVATGPSRLSVKMIEKEFDIMLRRDLASQAVA